MFVLLYLCGLTVAVHFVPSPSAPACPSHCLCDASLEHVNCSAISLTHMNQLALPLSPISLMLDQNSLSSLPAQSLSALTHLQFLAANNNNITYLGNGSLCERNRLLHLFVEYNRITWIESDYLKDCHELVTLELRSNYLFVEDIAPLLQYMPGLETLDLSNNQFHNNTILPVTFSHLNKLQFFYIDEMQEVHTIGPDFFLHLNTSGIKEFSLAGNMITFVSNETFANMLDLNFLDVSQTMITWQNLRDIFFVLGQTNLKKLNMKSVFVYRSNAAIIGPHLFKHLRNANLHVLHAEGNFAGFDGKLEKSSLLGLQHLRELYLDYNQLHWIHARAFVHLTRLKVLSLSHNLLSCSGGCEFLSHTLPQLTTLRLSDNMIDNSLEKVFFHDSGLPKLRHLLLERNRLRSLDQLTFILPFLHSLDLSENPIAFIETGTFSTMAVLKTLAIDDCIHLESLSPKVFAGLHILQMLTLNNNRLSKLDDSSFFGLTSLLHLEIRHNRLTSSKAKPLKIGISSKNLTVLDLSYNNIRALHLAESKLESLNLNHNEISNLEYISYGGKLKTLVNLDVSYNYLQNLPDNVIEEISRISSVVLEGNPFYCDCNGLTLQRWSQTSGSELQCSAPADRAGYTLAEVNLGECQHHRTNLLLPLMVTFIVLFVIVTAILFGVAFYSGCQVKQLFVDFKDKTKKKTNKPSQRSIQTIEEDTELKESLSGSSQCLNLNHCLSSEDVEVTTGRGTEPLMFYAQDVQSTI